MKTLKKLIPLSLSILVLIPCITSYSYALERENEVILRNNRYYYTTERQEEKYGEMELVSSDHDINGSLVHTISSLLGFVYLPAAVLNEINYWGNYIYDLNVDGLLKVYATEYKVYKNDRLTGEKTYVSDRSYTKLRLEVYKRRAYGLELYKTFEHTLYNK
ncbi:hypothetical protein [Peptoniphilus raoultii]|uniref:hypothetical protein n=1 Tax=Peptoniphilus raoultii TaxID=1776387 RepID=UPI0008D9819E|nr:hypothetical protein [Peptoniphilus raoultii]